MQALGLVREFARGNASKFFEDRGWYPADVRSRVEASTIFRADLVFETKPDDRYLWQFDWGFRSGRNLREAVWHLPPGAPRPSRKFDYSPHGTRLPLNERPLFRKLRIPGSAIAFFDFDSEDEIESELNKIAEWAQNITSLELLSPTAMRRGTRGPTNNIGTSGERLASFLASLDAKSRSGIVKRLSAFYPVRNVETTRKRAGWINMKIAENFRNIGGISPTHTSDGFLRLLALCAIPEFDENTSIVMLDEIENGIEPHILPEMIEKIVSDSGSQFIFASHSPLLINFFEPTNIHLLTRRKDGGVATARFSDLGSWNGGLEFFGPGELWSMAEKETIQKDLFRKSPPPLHRKGSRLNRFSVIQAHAFMAERSKDDA